MTDYIRGSHPILDEPEDNPTWGDEEMKHSKGEWGHGGDGLIYAEGQLSPVANVYVFPANPDQGKANARLIAAAPEMLELLRQFVKPYREISNPTTSMPGRVYKTWQKAEALLERLEEK